MACKFFFSQRMWNDADHSAASVLRGFCHKAHQAIVATAINQLTLVLANPSTHLNGGFGEQGQVARA
jgi:hypothetical protein